MKYLHPILLFLFSILLLGACKKGDPPTPKPIQTLELDITGLKAAGAYQVWAAGGYLDGPGPSPHQLGSFSVSAAGELSKTSFPLTADYHSSVWINFDSDPTESVILSGNISNNSAVLTTSSIGDFSNISGGYFLATPSDGDLTNEKSGLWWFNPTTMEGLNLPELSPVSWMYKGWVAVDSGYLSTGEFFELDEPDLASPYKDSLPDYAYPGEDFLQNPPTNITFPLDLSGKEVLVTVQPAYQGGDTPYFLEVFRGTIPANADSNTFYDLTNTSETITGISGTAEIITQ